MNVAIIADIHGNAAALELVLRRAKDLNVTRLLIAGDLIGYYYSPAKVLSLLAEWQCDYVKGNHDTMLEAWETCEDRRTDLAEKYGHGLEVAADELSVAQKSWLKSLPISRHLDVAGRRVLLCHGTPESCDIYVYPDATTEQRQSFFSSAWDVAFFGHTHYPVVWRNGHSLAVNPGSVGQPRDYQPGAAWALWNTATDQLSLHREIYDSNVLQRECHRRDPALPYLQHVLTRTSKRMPAL